ncbi:S41 family peptidase [Candidatus Poribacteria bacterium]|nr:S41 family peptidase [Candidatus Poribacteria bacterium]
MKAAVFAFMLAAAFAHAAPTVPHVVVTTPTLEARFVDPSLAELAVQFDQPMNPGSWSWCGGGGDYPELTGRPSYRDEFTAVLPVKLKPEQSYRLAINCASARNFRSQMGVSAEPVSFRFTTGPGSELIAAHIENYSAWREFKRLFDAHYSYRDRTGTEWDSVFKEAEPWVLRAPAPWEWGQRVATLLEQARDPHLYLRGADGSRLSTHSTRAVYNGNPRVLEATFPAVRKHNDTVWSDERDGIGYLAIRTWENEKQLGVLPRVLGGLMETKVLILDVRENGGGDELAARRVAAWFLEKDAPYSRHRLRNPEAESGWEPESRGWVTANPPEKRYAGQVLVLQGPVCLSSNEAFLLMMRQAPRATTIGAPSGGSSGRPVGYDLPNGMRLFLPSWQAMELDGTVFEGRGIAPDIAIGGDFQSGDPVLEEALRLAGAAAKSGTE